MKNWKTTLAGIAVAAIAAATALNWLTIEQGMSITAALVAVGLIAAKDNNVTGGTVKQSEKPFKNNTLSLVFALLSISMLASSCKVTFVPAANIEMKTDVNTGAQKTDALYLKMIGSTDKTFASYSNDYAEVEASINSIVLRDSVRTKGGNIFKSAQILRDHFKTYSTDHLLRGKLTTGELSAYMNYLRAFWRPLQVQENSLK
jgi:hypothetical protein